MTDANNANKEELVFARDTAVQLLRENYDKIKEILDEYMDMEEDDKILIAVWIIGTYFYKEFISFPYLFINAMKLSGKTRLENIIKHLAWNGEMLASLREATIFRTAGKKTLIIDEFENIGNKETLNLQELLNAGYKKGMKVFRMRKVKKFDGEAQEIEEFEPYCPIVMANINGMGDTLLSRCISIILERSLNPIHALKIEDFDTNVAFSDIKLRFKALSPINMGDLVYRCIDEGLQGVYVAWNNWIDERYYTHNTSIHTIHTIHNNNINNDDNKIYNHDDNIKKLEREAFFLKIHDAGIIGRDFELFFSLFMISYVLGSDILDKMIEIAKNKTNLKKIDEGYENNDILLTEFVSKQDEGFVSIKEFTEHFKLYIGETNFEKDSTINRSWLGLALKRLNLIIKKRRTGQGIEVLLNIEKAKRKAQGFAI